MRRAALTGLILLTLSACVSPQTRAERNRPLAANPSAIIAAEIAFNRLAQDKGMIAAFRETAHKDAVMFKPQRVRALDWLKTGNLGSGISWAPHAVYTSCDGSAGATTGAWNGPGGSHGTFTTVWLRERDGSFKWVLDHGAPLTGSPREAPEFIEGRQAVCGSRPSVGIETGAEGDDLAIGLAADQSLSWRSQVRRDGSRRITVRMWDGSAMQPVIDDDVTAAQARSQ
ncbi:MAG: hypothetical protein H2056_00180 [Sphingopyxis sp.]|nr:hypothetical protein [Sphingopyxis sp.]